ncbi:unnamed protein product [Peniophora sp. CBMAI 1063]|nr:unnamed protein product [Peniophora sp. CBMAI 1063]
MTSNDDDTATTHSTPLSPGATSHHQPAIPDSLPAEILQLIFEELSLQSPINLTMRELGWLVVSHVSRRWREAAIDHAGLWSTLDLGQYQLWPIFLERSRDTPLSI